jgi:hypothetical protein
MLERDRRRAGLSVARLSLRLGVTVREYRELVEEARPSYAVWERIAEFSGWPGDVRANATNELESLRGPRSLLAADA